MKVLLLSPSGVLGGAERALVGLARHLPAHGFEPTTVLLESGPLETWLAQVGCPVEVIKAGRTRHLHRTFPVIQALARRAKLAGAIVSNQSKGHVYGGLAASFAHVPALWWQQGVSSKHRIEDVAALVPAAAVICSSSAAMKAQRRFTPRRRIEHIPLGVDVTQIAGFLGAGAAIRQRCGWAGGRVVGIVGRLEPWKGQDVFLRAAARLADRHPHLHFAVIGGAVLGSEGDYPNRLHRLAEELGISDRVFFACHQDPVYPWFDALDLVVHASFDEPFGLVLVEAMAMAKPLVAAASGGPIDIVEEGVSGLLFRAGDDENLAVTIEQILEDPPLATRLAQGARLRATRFSDEAMTARFAKLLKELTLKGVQAV